MIDVTLVIPNRNNARFLPRCLESAGAQTRPFREIIVVDDASTDGSADLLRRYAAGRPELRLIELPERAGVSAARNAGVRAATTPYVTFIDSDDFFWSAEKNERESALIESHLPRGDVVAFSDVRLVDETGADLGTVSARRRVREGRLFWHLLLLDCLVPRDFTYPRRLHEEAGGFDEALGLYEDWDFKLRLARLAEFRFAGPEVVAYRSNPAGLSRASLRAHWSAMRRVSRRNMRHLPLHRRLPGRFLAEWSVARFLKGAFWTWLKQQAKRSARS